jgi:hypothetical protein
MLNFLHDGSSESMGEDDWLKNMKAAFNIAHTAIERFTDALVYYPEWEEAYLMRAEAYRCRVPHFPKGSVPNLPHCCTTLCGRVTCIRRRLGRRAPTQRATA